MRMWALLAILLAGCAQSPSVEDTFEVHAIEPELGWTRQVIAEGDVVWHESGSATPSVSQVAQVTAHPCIYDEGEEIYFTNQLLTHVQIPNGTTSVAVTLDWDDTSYLRDALRVGYRAPSQELYRESAPFARGEALELPVSPADWAEPGAIWGGGMDVWACLDTDTGDGLFPPSLFHGEIRYRIEAFA